VNQLTDHEMDVLMTYAQVGTYRLTAEKFGVSRFTIRNELATIRQKLDVETSIQALWLVTTGEEAA
jgi:DNA-binding CsgD family transcriptional regulator